jgi:dTDP-4-amino-4,6-dideoxygalactose transaminase
VRPELLRSEWTRDRIVDEVVARGIPCSAGGCGEIYLEKAFDGMRPKGRLPVAKLLGETSLMFQVHPTLTEEEMRDTVRVVDEVMAEASV